MKFFIAFACLLAVAAAAPAEEVAVLRNVAEVLPDSYNYAYELGNGVAASESGALNGAAEPSIAAQGEFRFTSPEGESFAVTYVADENGFQPSGAHLPVAPEIPVAIQRALEYIASHPSADQQ